MTIDEFIERAKNATDEELMELYEDFCDDIKREIEEEKRRTEEFLRNIEWENA